jgi:hypothetical protein
MPISTFPRHDYYEDEYLLKPAGLRDTHSEGKVTRANDEPASKPGAFEYGRKVRRNLALDVRWNKFRHDDSGSERIRLYGLRYPISYRPER